MSDALCARDLTLGYGSRHVVGGLDLMIPPGRFTVLAGPNGSGKSTLLRALAGVTRPQAGAVLLGDRPLASLSARAIARRIGILPQAPQAPEGMRVIDLVRMGRHPHRGMLSRWTAADEAACERALRQTGTADLRLRPLDALSGGQRQRAWIAMVLAQESRIVLLDEPTSFLDLRHQQEVLGLIADLVAAGGTVVAVLHDLNQAARQADHLVLLSDGGIAAEGPPGQVLRPETIARVFGVEVQLIPDPETGRNLCLPRLAPQRPPA